MGLKHSRCSLSDDEPKTEQQVIGEKKRVWHLMAHRIFCLKETKDQKLLDDMDCGPQHATLCSTLWDHWKRNALWGWTTGWVVTVITNSTLILGKLSNFSGQRIQTPFSFFLNSRPHSRKTLCRNIGKKTYSEGRIRLWTHQFTSRTSGHSKRSFL